MQRRRTLPAAAAQQAVLAPPQHAGLDAPAHGRIGRSRAGCPPAHLARRKRERGHGAAAHAAALCCEQGPPCAGGGPLDARRLGRCPRRHGGHAARESRHGRRHGGAAPMPPGCMPSRASHSPLPASSSPHRSLSTQQHRAASTGRIDIIRALLEAEPKLLDARNNDKATPLLLAAAGGHQAAAILLASKGADVEARRVGARLWGPRSVGQPGRPGGEGACCRAAPQLVHPAPLPVCRRRMPRGRRRWALPCRTASCGMPWQVSGLESVLLAACCTQQRSFMQLCCHCPDAFAALTCLFLFFSRPRPCQGRADGRGLPARVMNEHSKVVAFLLHCQAACLSPSPP